MPDQRRGLAVDRRRVGRVGAEAEVLPAEQPPDAPRRQAPHARSGVVWRDVGPGVVWPDTRPGVFAPHARSGVVWPDVGARSGVVWPDVGAGAVEPDVGSGVVWPDARPSVIGPRARSGVIEPIVRSDVAEPIVRSGVIEPTFRSGVIEADGGAVEPERVRELGGDPIDRVGGPHHLQDRRLDAVAERGVDATPAEAGREQRVLPPRRAEHRRHVVGHPLAMHPCGRREREVEGGMTREEVGPRLEKADHLGLVAGRVGVRPVVARSAGVVGHARPSRAGTREVRATGKDASVMSGSLFRGAPDANLEQAAAMPKRTAPRRVSVLLPYPFDGAFDYAVPDGLAPPPPGTVVLVPLNRRATLGVVWDAAAPDDAPPGPAPRAVADAKLRPIEAVLDATAMPAALRRFVDWIARYTLTPPGLVLAMAFRVDPRALPAPSPGWRRADAPPASARLTEARRRVLDQLQAGRVLSAAALARASGVGAGVVRAMGEAGLLLPAEPPRVPAFGRPEPGHAPPALGPDQARAAALLADAVSRRQFSATLLDGVTGSGKTEVYAEAVAACLRAGRQALVLLPEIALSAQWLARFERRFGAAPAVWHSELGGRRRRLTWHAVAAGEAPVVVGARSALFLPFPDLGLVVVDEEHETAFKQEEGVIYHARDMAVVRARLSDAPVVLVSATPSLETLANVEAGRYGRASLPARHGGAVLPSVAALDMRQHPPPRGRFLSPVLVDAAADAIGRGEQAMLFLNRRGYAPMTLCRACGHRLQCPNCTAWLVEHRARRLLACHHCDHREALPPTCPVCGAADSLAAIGPGIERVTEEAASLLPGARVLVMSSDTLPGPGAAAAAAAAIERRDIDLVIGTQIVAKGWHFPHLTLVGVVDADLGLAGGDLRASERTVQLLHQVAGRAGRAQAPGRVLLQTWSPEHPVMQALVANDFARFMATEADARRPGHWPPFGRLAALIVSADDAAAADAAAAALGRAAPSGEGVVVLGPAPAPLAILRGRHRRRLLLRTRRSTAVQPILRAWLASVRPASGVRIDVDVDPVSFL